MGAGKSTVGNCLATEHHLGFVDLDAAIEEQQGRSITDIFQYDGEQVFRDIEQQTLAEVLSASDPLVVSCGGGVVVRQSNLKLLSERAWVCWLRATVDTLAQRIQQSRSRPLLGDDPKANIKAIYKARAGLYAQVAHEVIDVDDLRPEQVCEAIRNLWPSVITAP